MTKSKKLSWDEFLAFIPPLVAICLIVQLRCGAEMASSRSSLFTCIVSSLPLTLSNVHDIAQNYNTKTDSIFSNSLPFWRLCSKSIPSIAILIPDILLLLLSLDPQHNVVNVLFLVQLLIISHIVLMTALSSDFESSRLVSPSGQRSKILEYTCRVALSALNSGTLLLFFTFNLYFSSIIVCLLSNIFICGAISLRVFLILRLWFKTKSITISSEKATEQANDRHSNQESVLRSCCWYSLYLLIMCSQMVVFQESANNKIFLDSHGFLITFFMLMIFVFNERTSIDDAKLLSVATEMNRVFVRYISHELRSYVSHLSMGLEQLGDEVSPVHSLAHKMIEELQDSCDSSLQILNDILIVDELHKTAVVRDVDVKHVKKIVQRSIVVMKPLLNLREVDLDVDLTNISSSTLLSFSANVDEIMQVLRYLLGNAAKCSQPGDSISLSASIAESHPSPSLVSFTPLSMKSIRASISSVHVGDLLKMDEPSYSLILRVADSGIGMSTEDLQAAFSKRSNDVTMADNLRGGVTAGLIFPITKAMVERNGGTLKVESAGRGLGCTYTVTLPLFKKVAPAHDTHDFHPELQSCHSHQHEPLNAILENSIGFNVLNQDHQPSSDESEYRPPVLPNLPPGANVSGYSILAPDSDVEAGLPGPASASATAQLLLTGTCTPSPELVLQQEVTSRPGQEWSAFIFHNLTSQLERVYPCAHSGPPTTLQLDDIAAGATVLSRDVITFPWTNKTSLNILSDAVDGGEFTSVLAGPVLAIDGKVLGVIEAVNTDRSVPFTAADEEFMALLCQRMRSSFATAQPEVQGFVRHTATRFKTPTELHRHNGGANASERSSKSRQKLQNLLRASFMQTLAVTALRFLVVDESSTSRKVLVHMLRKLLAHSVDEVDDGAQALVMIEQAQAAMRPYAGVFIDRNLPTVDGPLAVRLMRERGYGGRIISLAGWEADDDVDVCLENGASIVLEKPLNLALVMKIVDGIKETFSDPNAAMTHFPLHPRGYSTASAKSTPKFNPVSKSQVQMHNPSQIQSRGDLVATGDGKGMSALIAPVALSALRILVVDDVNSSRKFVTHMLTSLTVAEIEEATDSAVALSRVQMAMQAGRPFDIVFLTYMTPILDGPSTARQMKAMGFTGQIVGLAGLSDKDRLAYGAHGVATVLEYPVKLSRLREILYDFTKSMEMSVPTHRSGHLPCENMADSLTGHDKHSPGVMGLSLNENETQEAVVASQHSDVRVSSALRFLVVDDVSSNRKILARMFTKMGHHVVEAIDGLQAVEQYSLDLEKGNSFHAVFMDFVMPNMDGPSATSSLRRLGYMGPIYGVTGNVLEADVKHFLSSGATRVVHKPIKTDTVGKLLSEIHRLRTINEPISNL